MARKKDVYKIGPLTEEKKNIIAGLLQEYDIQTAEDIRDALKDLLGGTVKQMLESEKDDHLVYDKYERLSNLIAATERNQNMFVVNYRIDKVLLNRKLFQSAKKTFQQSMII